MKALLKYILLFILGITCNYSSGQLNLNTNLAPGQYYNPTDVNAEAGSVAQGTNAGMIHLFINSSASTTPVNYVTQLSTDINPSPLNIALPVGTTQSSYGISPTGAATYNVPIIVPPGTMSMVPNLSINYNSQTADGLLGVGWNLSGLSVISRMGQTPYHNFSSTYPDQSQAVTLTNSDWFALDGKRLIATAGSNGATGTTYATENETFNLITSNGTMGNGPEWFQVQSKSGLTLEYGRSLDSRLISVGQTTVFTWLLDKITDQFGNYITFKYQNSNGEAHIQEIDYTGNTNAGTLPYNSVVFNYVHKNDANTFYTAEGALNSSVVLNNITVNCHGSFFKQYSFQYAFNMHTLLQEIDEKGADGSTLNPLRFTYSADIPTAAAGQEWYRYWLNSIQPPPTVYDNFLQQYTLLDYNGDGKMDLVDFQGTYSTVVGNSTSSALWSEIGYTESWTVENLYDNLSTPGYGASGYPGFSLESTPNFPVWDPMGPSTNISPLLYELPVNNTAPGDLGTASMDFNGDGKDDIASSTFINNPSNNTQANVEEDIHIALSNGSSFQPANTLQTYQMNPMIEEQLYIDGSGNYNQYTQTMNLSGTFYLDMNGDGQMDVFNYYSNGLYDEHYSVWLNAGASPATLTTSIPTNSPNFEIDVKEPAITNNSWMDGNGNSYSTTSCTYLDFSNAFPMDLDGDGRQELVNVIQYTAGNNTNSQTTMGTSQRVIVRFDATKVNTSEVDGVAGQAGEPGNGIIVQPDNSPFTYNSNTYVYGSGYADVSINNNGSPYVLFGDFNGDGISDVLTYNGSWALNLGEGEGYYSNVPVTTLTTDNPFSYPSHFFYAVDVNGDGKTDIVEFIPFRQSPGVSGNTVINIYYSTGTSFVQGPQVTLTDEDIEPTVYQIGFGDFNGDGVNDLFLCPQTFPYFISGGLSYNTTPQVIELYKGSQSKYIAEAIDGYNEKVKFYYQPLTNPSVYSQSSAASTYRSYNNTNSLLDLAGAASLYVATRITAPGGSGMETYTYNTNDGDYDLADTNSTLYTYQDAILSEQGIGFLGFLNIVSLNSTTSLRTSVSSSVQDVPSNSAPYFPCELLPSVVSKSYYYDPGNIFGISLDQYTYDYPVLGGLRYFIPMSQDVHTDELNRNTTTTKYTYDSYGNIQDQNTQISVTSTSNIVETTDVQKTYVQSDTWIPSSIQNTTSTITQYAESPYQASEAPYQRTTYNNWDNAGHLLSTVTDPASLTEAVTTANTYANTGVLLSQTISSVDPTCATRKTSYKYDAYSQFQTSVTNPLGQVTQYNYDYRWGKPTKEITPDGLTTSYVYDAYGRTTQSTTPDGIQQNTSYSWTSSTNFPLGTSQPFDISPAGLNTALYTVHSIRNGSPSVTNYYDWYGRINGTACDGFNGATVYTEKSYDVLGNLYRSSSPYENGGLDAIVNANYYNADQYHRLTQSNVLDYKDSLNSNAPCLITTIAYTANTSLGTMQVTTTNPDGTASSQTYDPAGLNICSTDNLNSSLNKTYFSNGKVNAIYLNGTEIESYEYDAFARLTQKYDQNFGGSTYPTNYYTYQYNAYNQLIYQQDINGNIYNNFIYDALGRLTSKKGTEGTYANIYVTTGNGLNSLQSTTLTNSSGNTTYSYTYDKLRRPLTVNENGLTTSLQYDIYSNVINKTFPGGFGIINTYDGIGNLIQTNQAITTGTVTVAGPIIWQANKMDPFMRYTQYTLGNGVQTQKTYSPYEHLQTIVAGGIQNMAFDFDPRNGNLISRTDNIIGLTETFSYTDKMNRLNEASSPNADVTVSYDPAGNIISKSDVCASPSTYTDGHNNNQPTEVPNNSINAINPGQTISYSPFNAPSSITQNSYSLTCAYGPDNSRVLTTLVDPLGNTTARYYASNYEKTILNNTSTTEVNYINCGGSLVAMYVNQPSGGDMYYVYSDHLGSILTVTDGTTANTYAQSFDAWGNYRNPTNWAYSSIPNHPNWLYRGFTGHEHLPEFQLINMNARLYDPFEGNFLSVDVCTNEPYNTQNYNRYAYCFNNPLKYRDPSGNWAVVDDILAALVGGTFNLVTNWGSVHNFWQGLEYFGAGAAGGEAALYGGPLAGFSVGGSLNVAVDAANGNINSSNPELSLAKSFVTGGTSALTGGASAFGFAQGANEAGLANEPGYSFWSSLSPVSASNPGGSNLMSFAWNGYKGVAWDYSHGAFDNGNPNVGGRLLGDFLGGGIGAFLAGAAVPTDALNGAVGFAANSAQSVVGNGIGSYLGSDINSLYNYKTLSFNGIMANNPSLFPVYINSNGAQVWDNTAQSFGDIENAAFQWAQ